MAEGRNVQEVGMRVEELLGELRTGDDPTVPERAEELVCLLMELYGTGFRRVLDLIGREPAGSEIVGRLAQDPLVASLLVLHGLHPVPLEKRIAGAVESVRRPHLGNGQVDLAGVDEEGIVRLELSGGFDSCSSSLAGAKLALEKAVLEACPETIGVVMETDQDRLGNAVRIDIGRAPVPVSIGQKPGGPR